MPNDLEQFIEEMTKAIKSNVDLSVWQKNPKYRSLVNLLIQLSNLPKTPLPRFDFERVRGQILDRITMSKLEKVEKSSWLGKFSVFTPYLSIGAGVMAGVLIVVSITLGTAVAALESTPGSYVYPLKKIVENIELKLAPTDQQAALQIRFADNRAEELQQVLQNQQDGKISDQEAQTIVASTVQDLKKSTAAVASNVSKNPTKSSTAIVNKLSDISNKLRAASVQSEGVVKIELEKALQDNQTTQEQAIKNLEQAGLKVDSAPISADASTTTKDDNSIKASGKLTNVTDTSVSIGTAKFLLTKDTKFVNMDSKDLKTDLLVDIVGQIKDNKSYALQITKVSETNTETPATNNSTDTQSAPTTK